MWILAAKPVGNPRPGRAWVLCGPTKIVRILEKLKASQVPVNFGRKKLLEIHGHEGPGCVWAYKNRENPEKLKAPGVPVDFVRKKRLKIHGPNAWVLRGPTKIVKS